MPSFQFEATAGDSQWIGRRLGVGAVLEGSVRRSGDRLRITTQLISVTDGCHLWSNQFDRTFDFARQMFSKAIEYDPEFARAYAGLANCWSMVCRIVDRSEQSLQEADRASQRAVELRPGLAEARAARGFALSQARRYAESDEEFRVAIELDPELYEAYYHYGLDRWDSGDLERAAQLLRKAATLRTDGPEKYRALSWLVSVYSDMGAASEKRAAAQECVAAVERHLEMHPDDSLAMSLAGCDLISTGDGERGLEWLDRALAVGPEDFKTLYNVACGYALVGKIQSALDCLERALHVGIACRAWLESDRGLDALREHPRFQALLAQAD